MLGVQLVCWISSNKEMSLPLFCDGHHQIQAFAVTMLLIVWINIKIDM